MVTLRALVIAIGFHLAASVFATAQTRGFEASVTLGDSLMTAGRTTEAIEAYREGIGQYPENATLLCKLSIALASWAQETPGRDGDEETLIEAVRVASAAVSNDPDLSRAYTALSIAVGRYGEHLAHVYRIRRAREVIDLAKQAKVAVEYAIVLDPYDFAPYTMLGIWHRELTTVHPVAKTIARLLLGGYPDVSLKESERLLGRAVELAPDRVTVRMQLALTYFAMDDVDAALRELEVAAELDPQSGFERLEQEEARELIEELR
jgi:tetratricopeptide (TPR) repeat protein